MNYNLQAYYEALLLKSIREGDGDEEGEGQFGLVPFSMNPNHLLNQVVKNTEHHASLGPKLHPLLGKSQQFSGIDKQLTASPQENSKAQEVYPQLRLNNKLQLQEQKKKAPPRLVR